ncbi:40-kDa huntingtin-associated protein-like [Tubulanus polymorphus]|uniref:40-kDa huntingtin-associated protein-like n=1 Tax=Tubulanus polymorphus TaxID=672921 RepID=UPI003DA2D85E
MDKDADVLGKYRHISDKLKKRFLKKPNVSEGSEQFASLAKILKQQESPQYAGFCCLAQARCEHSLSNPAGEAQALVNAARNFLEADIALRDLKCPNFDEHISAAVNCYSHAIRVHLENKQTALAAALSIELGNALRDIGKTSEAIVHYQKAADLQIISPLDCLDSMQYAASGKIETKDYDGALNTLTEMVQIIHDKGGVTDGGKPMGAFCDFLARAEITRVLLLMLLQPTPQRIRPEHAQTLEKYAWESTENNTPVNYMSEDLFLLLQSVVMACQVKDFESLKALQVELWPMLQTEQNQLLHLVIQELEHPSGEGL